MLLDAATFELCSRFDEVVDALADGPLDGRAHPELMQSTLEVASVVCRDVDDLRRDLETVRRGITAAIEPLGMRLAGAGAHPFSRSEDQRITTRDRYRWLVEQLQYVARRELVFGMHVHVAVPDPDPRDARDGESARRAPGAAGALGQLAVLARRSHRPRLDAHGDLRVHAALGPAAALRLLRRLPRDGRDDGGRRRDRRLHVPVVGRAAAPTARHGRDPRHGRAVRPRPDAHAGRVRAGERRRARSTRRGAASSRRHTTGSSCPRTSGPPRATASTRC